jgi:hypothetical protein
MDSIGDFTIHNGELTLPNSKIVGSKGERKLPASAGERVQQEILLQSGNGCFLKMIV